MKSLLKQETITAVHYYNSMFNGDDRCIYFLMLFYFIYFNINISTLSGLVVSMCGTLSCGFWPGRGMWIFLGDKNL
jgi:hypothetical protein